MSSTTPSSPDVTTRISVDRNDRQVVVAVEDATPGGPSIVASIDPLVDRQVLEQLVDELLAELDRVRTSTKLRRRAYAAIGTIDQTTLQGPAAADVLQDRSELIVEGASRDP